MPYLKIRLSAAALLLFTGCAAPNFFAASPGNKANAEATAPNGPRPSAFTNSWSGTQHAGRAPQDAGAAAGAAAAAAGDSERRIQDLLAAGERSNSSGDDRAARNAFDQVLRLAPGDAFANYQMAILDDKEGRFADAERHYFTVMKQRPNNPDVLSSLGWSYFLQGRFDDSDRVLREALRYDPNHQFALNNLAWLYGTRGDYDGALAIFRSAGSEADAQNALAMLKQNAGAVPVAGEQNAATPLTSGMAVPGNTPGNSPVNASGNSAVNSADSRGGTRTPEPEFATPQARKFAEDFKRLKADNDRQQQERRSRLTQKNISAPSPWNNNRQAAANAGQRDSGQTMRAGGQMEAIPAGNGALRGGSADPVQMNGRYPASDAAFPGAAPSQANRARLADPADYGSAGNMAVPGGTNAALSPGTPAIPGTQAIYEQPAGVGTQGQSRSPVITPAGEFPASRGNNSSSWNSLPPDDSYRGNSGGSNVPPPAGRLSDWPRNGAGNLGSTDQSFRNSAGQAGASGQFHAAPPRGRNSRQDAQTTAAQMGLSAGSGGLGFPASDWPSSPSSQTAGTGNGPSPPGGQNPSGGQYPNNSQSGNSQSGNSQSAGQQPTVGGQYQGTGPSSATSNGPASSLPPWPGRPLSGGSVPQAVVPSAQGVVYGSTGDSGMPNLYSGKPTTPPAR